MSEETSSGQHPVLRWACRRPALPCRPRDPDGPRRWRRASAGRCASTRATRATSPTASEAGAVYLTGSHTWNNLVDMGRGDPPEAFDFDAYLDFLERHGHNFIRLWAWDSVTWDTRANGTLGKDFVHHVAPLPWARTGPGQGPRRQAEVRPDEVRPRLLRAAAGARRAPRASAASTSP